MGVPKRLRNLVDGARRPRFRKFWITLGVIILGLVVWLVFVRLPWEGLWEWMTVSEIDMESSSETGSTTMRNVGLVVAGVVTVGLLIWRGYVANKQASAAQRQADIAQRQEEKAQHQVDIAQRQAETAQQSLRNERYQKGADMLGSEVLSVRMGGIYALQRLAKEYPGEYHIQIMRLLCAFVRRPTPDKDYEAELRANMKAKLRAEIRPRLHAGLEGPVAREDVLEAMQVIGARGEKEIALERSQEFELDLRHARLHHMNLRGANLTGAHLYKANLFQAFLLDVGLTDAWLGSADLSEADLQGAVLLNATLFQAVVSDTSFAGVRDLTQNQLDQARRTEPGEKPPDLGEAFDARTGKQLNWRK